VFRIPSILLLVIALPLSSALADSTVSSSSSSSASGAFVCTDSDGGLDYAVRGTAKGWDDAGAVREFTDVCGRGHLIEYRCLSRSYVQKVIVSCQYDCSNGACLSKQISATKKPLPTRNRTQRLHISRGRNGER
jgi:hypothetical protein